MQQAHLERLLRKAVAEGNAKQIERLVRQGAVGDVKGDDGRDAIDLIADIKDAGVRNRCRIAFLAEALEEFARTRSRKSHKR